MKPSKNVLLLLSTFVLAASCGGGDKSSSPAPVAQQASQQQEQIQDENASPTTPTVITQNGITFSWKRAVELNKDFSNAAEVKENLNKFEIDIKLDAAMENRVNIKCSNIDQTHEPLTAEILSGDKDANIPVEFSAKDLRIILKCAADSAGSKLFSGEFSFAKSLFIDSEASFQDQALRKSGNDYYIDRLIITDTGVLLTNGESFVLNANKVISNRGTIQSFKKEDLKPKGMNKPGKSGGDIVIGAEESVGPISIVMLGQDADNRTDKPEDRVCNHKEIDPSRNARPNTYEREHVCFGSNTRSMPIGASLFSPTGRDHCVWIERGDKGSPAIKGPDGIDGVDAYPGLNGGNAGTVNYITKKSSSDFKIDFTSQAGRGAKAGLPGLPCVRGIGGAGAKGYDKAPDGVGGKPGRTRDSAGDDKIADGEDGQPGKLVTSGIQK